MSEIRIRRALISVYDKSGVVGFARALHDEFGVQIISTGGTAKLLAESGIPVTLVEEITGFPEMLEGRVKTLHPKIHAAILADRDNPEHMRQLAEQGIEPIDMVVVNLYPFKETIADPKCRFEDAIEMIDVGGPCLLRAAAKNHEHVVAVTDPQWYSATLRDLRAGEGQYSYFDSLGNATDVFEVTSKYDLRIYRFWSEFIAWHMKREGEKRGKKGDAPHGAVPAHAVLAAVRQSLLRYGENPHQEGSLWRLADTGGLKHWHGEATDEADLIDAEQVGGEPMSFNNYADASAALELCKEISWEFYYEVDEDGANGLIPACVFFKHQNPCGVGLGEDPIDSYRQAYLGDPQAAMGGVLAVNFGVDAAFAEAVMDSLARWGKAAGAGAFFVEVWLAPSFDEEAVKVIQSKKSWGRRVRLLAAGDVAEQPDPNELDVKKIVGGLLVQSRDMVGLEDEENWKVVTKREPTGGQMQDLRLAWLVCKHTKSNAITVCRDGMLLGNGAGQMSRVMSCRIATWLAKENGHGEKLKGAVAASDAFFPFRDGPDILMDAGVAAIIQPGGSKRDEETIGACDERGVAMVFTGTRHFRH